MIEPNLSLQVAAGILIAWIVIFIAKYSAHCWKNDEPNMGLLTGAFAAFIGGGLVLAGMGIIGW